jgi:hypothetical protein
MPGTCPPHSPISQVIGVLIIMNIVIAIIADAYSEANERMEEKTQRAIENEEKPILLVMTEVKFYTFN